MGLSIEIKVNGTPVAMILAHNTGVVASVDNIYKYDGTVSGVDIKGNPFCGHLETVLHKRSDSILSLASTLLGARMMAP